MARAGLEACPGAGHVCAVRGEIVVVLSLLPLACISIAEVEPCAPVPVAEAPQQVSWHADIRPIIEGRCASCHSEGNVGPLSLTSYAEVFAVRAAVRAAVVARRMPPWQPASCCNAFLNDMSLSESQVAAIDAWVQQGGPQGEASDYPGPLDPVGGLSRVDVRVQMPEAYAPQPAPGHFDDFRCFAVDWPLTEPVYVTGINPVPGARDVVHHMVIAYAEGDAAKAWQDKSSPDGRPGVPCEGGLADVEFTDILGGSLLGGDFPEGIGTRIEPGAKIILDVHYSLAGAAARPDQTTIELKVEPITTPLQQTETLVLANPAWLVSDAMRIEPGVKDQRFRFQYDPRVYTHSKPVLLRGFTPHMHAFGTQMIASVVRKDGRIDCLTDIQSWDFGWEQPLWFAQPIRLEVGDEVYISCTFDNSAENQPIVGGRRLEPRAIAWGTDQQDMCAGFLSFTPEAAR